MFWKSENSAEPVDPCEKITEDMKKCVNENKDEQEKCKEIINQFEIICNKKEVEDK